MNQYIGKILDNRYEILDVIGVGGMAVVYKAYCHRLHRFVAIKILKRDLAADAEFRPPLPRGGPRPWPCSPTPTSSPSTT